MPAEGGWPTQLTVSDQRQTSPAWSPDGKWIAYQSDYDGDEQWDIFFVSPKTGQVVNITNTREIAEENPTWSPDGRYLAYTVKPKTSSVYEIDIFDTLMRETQTPDHGYAQRQDERGIPSGPRMGSGSPTPSNRPRAPIRISLSPRWPPAKARC